jgi:hypothetical protein
MLQEEDPAFRACSVDDCGAEITGDAAEICWLFWMVSDQLRSFGEMGGGLALDLNAVEFLFRVYDVPNFKWQLYTEWLKVLVAKLILEPMQERNHNGG